MTEWIHNQLTKGRINVGPSDVNSRDMINVVRHRPLEITKMAKYIVLCNICNSEYFI